MTITFVLPLLVSAVGAALFFATPAKLSRFGEILLFAGLLAFLLTHK